MPINEALFWVSITVFGTGLYFIPDHKMLAAALIVVGLIGAVYSIYIHHRPDARRPPSWVLLMAITWVALGYSYYDRQRQPRGAWSVDVLPWALVCALAGIIAYLTYERTKRPTTPQIEEYQPEAGLETTTFNLMNTQFEGNFSWAQKVALFLIYERPSTSPSNLRTQLLSLGFGREVDEFIIEPIKKLDRTFIEMAPDGGIMPNPGRAKLIRVLLDRFRRNIL